MGRIILRLDRMMVERKMSLGELAQRVGISNVNLSKIKNNKVTAVSAPRATFWSTKRRKPGRKIDPVRPPKKRKEEMPR